VKRRAPYVALAAAVFIPALAAQQQAAPHAGYVYPAGGRRGARIEVRVGGQYLNGAAKAYVSGTGVKARVKQFLQPPTGAETQKLRDEMQKLNERRAASRRPPTAGSPAVPFTDAEEKRAAEIRDTLDMVQRRASIPAIADIVLLEVTIAPDAPLGPRRLRLEANAGLTNPIVFEVGELPEFSRNPARVPQAYNVVNGATPLNRAVARQPDAPTEITLPAVLNGQTMPGTAGQYRFHAAKGQHLIIGAEARELLPYLSDTVPGWFQAALTLRDSQGKELASADHFLFHQDPLLQYEIQSDGDYIAEIRDSIYRGREDFVYRLTIGELPVITSIFPLGGKAGVNAAIETHGWNLPAARVKESFKGKTAGVYPVTARRDGFTSNSAPFALDALPEAMAKPAIDRKEKAQRVKLPLTVNGRVARPGEAQVFRFDGRAGDEIVAEVIARRLGSPLDSQLRLTDAAGKELAFNDDFEDVAAGLLTHQADSLISYKVKTKGTYYLYLTDAQGKGGPEYGYRLRISHPRPDFELRVAPSSLNLRVGATAAFTVYALRRDGFAGEIGLKLDGAPAGFALNGAAIPAGQDKVRVTLTAPRAPVALPLSMRLTGQAAIEGRDVTRAALPAEDMEQAFAYHHLVAEDEWMVRVIGAGVGGVLWRPIEKPVKLISGSATPVAIFVPARLQSDIQMALMEPPEGISIQSVAPARDGVSVLLSVQRDKAKPGLKGNLILEAFREVAPLPGAANQARRRQSLGVLPAVPFEVVETAAGVAAVQR
jgi:hypothetical protein